MILVLTHEALKFAGLAWRHDFQVKGFTEEIYILRLSLSSHMCEQEKVPWEPKMPKQTKVFLSHVNLLFLAMTAIA